MESKGKDNMRASYFQEANQLWRSGKLEEAVEMYQKAIAQNPEFHLYHYNLGAVLRKLGRLEESEKKFKKAIELKPSDALPRLEIEQILEKKGEKKESVNPKMTELAPDVVSKSEVSESEVSESEVSESEVSEVIVNYGCWLSPRIIYIQSPNGQIEVLGEHKVLLLHDGNREVASAYFFELPSQEIGAIVMFERDIPPSVQKNCKLALAPHNSLVAIDRQTFKQCYGLEFIQYLNSKPEPERYLHREGICWSIIECNSLAPNLDAPQIIHKLQHFIRSSPSSLIVPTLPFSVAVEHLIPIGNEGVSLFGWLNDPYNALKNAELISDLGFKMLIQQSAFYFTERDDVKKYLSTTQYPISSGKPGFFAYVSVPEEIRDKLNQVATLNSFRLKFHLEGEIEFELIPDIKHYDVFDARKMLLQLFSSVPKDQIIENRIGPALSCLQRLFIQQIRAEEILEIKASIVHEPSVSIIIPLYKQLDFIKIQLATMANDSDIQQSEIIYVLDSPEQQQEVKNLLLEYNQIYGLPIKLVIMNHNSGYAIANNTGALYAKGKYLLLMNSDVFPKNKGWLSKMVQFYSASEKIGTLGPKLIYEDYSLQHAGMFFEKTIFPFWITGHYYKGLPNTYPSVNISRPVPAVTGACLMITKELYDLVGGYTTDYIIGDFEDSDLCFKCHDLGYESWYFSEVELYHLERQSMNLSPFNRSLSWRYNALLHHKKWNNKIQQLMDSCGKK